MPHFGIHLICLEKTIKRLNKLGRGYDRWFSEEQDLKAARWGAIGPDIFFWSYYEKEEVRVLQNIIYQVFEIFKILQEIEDIFEPIGDLPGDIMNYLSGDSIETIESGIEDIK